MPPPEVVNVTLIAALPIRNPLTGLLPATNQTHLSKLGSGLEITTLDNDGGT